MILDAPLFSLKGIPEETWHHVIDYLDYEAMYLSKRVCKALYQVVTQHLLYIKRVADLMESNITNRAYVIEFPPFPRDCSYVEGSKGLLCCVGRTIGIYDLTTDRCLYEFPPVAGKIVSFVASEHFFAVGNTNGTISVWDRESGRAIVSQHFGDDPKGRLEFFHNRLYYKNNSTLFYIDLLKLIDNNKNSIKYILDSPIVNVETAYPLPITQFRKYDKNHLIVLKAPHEILFLDEKNDNPATIFFPPKTEGRILTDWNVCTLTDVYCERRTGRIVFTIELELYPKMQSTWFFQKDAQFSLTFSRTNHCHKNSIRTPVVLRQNHAWVAHDTFDQLTEYRTTLFNYSNFYYSDKNVDVTHIWDRHRLLIYTFALNDAAGRGMKALNYRVSKKEVLQDITHLMDDALHKRGTPWRWRAEWLPPEDQNGILNSLRSISTDSKKRIRITKLSYSKDWINAPTSTKKQAIEHYIKSLQDQKEIAHPNNNSTEKEEERPSKRPKQAGKK